MSTDITKEELNAMLTVQAKSVEQQVIIAERLKVIVDNQEKTLSKLSNGLAKEITGSIKDCNTGVCEKIKEVKENTSTIKKDTTWIKWLFGSVGLIVTLSMVIINIYWLSHRASTATAVVAAIEERIEHIDVRHENRK